MRHNFSLWNFMLLQSSHVCYIHCVFLEDDQIDQNMLQWILCFVNNKNVFVRDELFQYNLCYHKMMFRMEVSPVQPWSYFLCCSLCMIHIIHGWATLTLLLLLLRRHYSQMQTPASLMDFSQSDVFWPLFPGFNFASINICLHTVPPSVFWSSY